jgi:hypothetical protein
MADSKTPKKRPKKVISKTSEKERTQMIEKTAYYLAEQRGFEGNLQLHDWLEAETRINHMFGSSDQ